MTDLPAEGPRGYDALALLGLYPTQPNSTDALEQDAPAVPHAEVTGRRVAEARGRAELTEAALAERVGLTGHHVSEIEAGRRRLSNTEMPAFAAALRVSIQFLIGRDEKP